MLLYPLPAPHRDATHIQFYEVLVTPNHSVRLTGRLGTVEDGEFVADQELRDVTRVIGGPEYADGFRPHVQGEGAPGGNFRDADLAYWLTVWGWRDGTAWAAAQAEPEEV